jgi:hypothetical protein
MHGLFDFPTAKKTQRQKSIFQNLLRFCCMLHFFAAYLQHFHPHIKKSQNQGSLSRLP